jgi:molybdate transport system substrate-binding protein
VYATDAVGVARVRVVATFPAASHPRITYPAATTVRGGSQAADFVRFLQGDEAQALFRKHGFMPP